MKNLDNNQQNIGDTLRSRSKSNDENGKKDKSQNRDKNGNREKIGNRENNAIIEKNYNKEISLNADNFKENSVSKNNNSAKENRVSKDNNSAKENRVNKDNNSVKENIFNRNKNGNNDKTDNKDETDNKDKTGNIDENVSKENKNNKEKSVSKYKNRKREKNNNNEKNNNKEKYAKKKFRMIRWIKIMTLLFVFIFALSIILVLIIDYHVEKTGKAKVLEIDEIKDKYDCVIVPGAMVFSNSTPSAMLADRLDVAFEIYNRKIAGKILVSGDHGTKEYDEVNVMRNYLISKGVPSEDIFMDHAGFDTYQTIYRARDVFKVKKALISTQDFHLFRAVYIGQKLSLNLDGVDSALRDYHNSNWNRAREYFARVKAFIESEITKPIPEFLGKVIPITGDGNQTIDSNSKLW